jgi:hypothetical protein
MRALQLQNSVLHSVIVIAVFTAIYARRVFTVDSPPPPHIGVGGTRFFCSRIALHEDAVASNRCDFGYFVFSACLLLQAHK